MSKKPDSLKKDILTDLFWIAIVNILFISLQISSVNLPRNAGDDAFRQFFSNIFSPYEYWYFNFSLLMIILFSIFMIFSRVIERSRKVN